MGRSCSWAWSAGASSPDRVVATLRVGDPVIVRGKLRAREYEKDGQAHSVMEVEAHVDRSGPRALLGERAEARRRTTAGEGDAGRSQSADGEGEQRDRCGVRAAEHEAAVGA